MKKVFLSALMAVAVLSANATVFYCDPASGNDEAQGSSWDDAVSVFMMKEALSSLVGSGDTIFIKGGTINFQSGNDAWVITGSIALIGGFDPAATGVATSLPTYPSATPTIFNGDINKDGVASAGDSPMLIRVDLSGANNDVVTLQGLDLINTYNTATNGTEDIDSYLDQAAALRTICGTVIVKNCHIYNHITPNCRGSQAVTVVGSKFHAMDCEVHDCVAMSRGGLFRSRNFFIGGDKTNPQIPEIVLERCCFYNGSALGLNEDDPSMSLEARIAAKDATLANGTYGGGLQISSGPLYMINTSILNNKNYSNGAGISGNVKGFYIISSTIGNNEGIRDDHDLGSSPKNCCYGSSLRMESDGVIKIANSFVTDAKDNTKKQYAPIYQDGNTKMLSECLFSGGYNVLGTVCYYPEANVDVENVWKETDLFSVYNGGSVDLAQTFPQYFGTFDNFKDNGGCSKSILPLQMQDGAAVAALQELADAWFPAWAHVDASLDQRGYQRDAAKTCVGAAAVEAVQPSNLPQTSARKLNKQSIKYMQEGRIMIQANGVKYNLLGTREL